MNERLKYALSKIDNLCIDNDNFEQKDLSSLDDKELEHEMSMMMTKVIDNFSKERIKYIQKIWTEYARRKWG